MKFKKNAPHEAAQLILKQAELVAAEVSRVEAIVDHAIGAAAIAMATVGKSDSLELAEHAKETLRVAREAASEVLHAAKIEAEKTLRLARELAESQKV